MAVTVDQFGKALVASGLMSADDVKALWAETPADKRPKEGEAFAKLLIERGTLTAFQARQILAGRGSSLVLGEYVVLQEIGAGGMGQVYKAQHRRMKRVVALKVMSGAAMKDEAAVKRFQREVEAAARLEHPNIVTAYDAGRAGNVNFLVMQFVDGGDLSSLVKKHGPLEVERAVDYVVQAARGLAYAHSEGVIHRDIKPANLLCDKKGVVKILDMGLARLEKGEDGLTATEQVMGTVDYMSPEQASNTKTADARSDVYSLGCTLWYLLTGRRAYDGESLIERLMAHRERELPSLVKARDDAPWPLEQAFHKMIAKQTADRFQTMDEVVAALEPFGGGGSRTSAGGMGSSLGMGSGPHDKELSAFFKTVGPAVKSPATKTAAPADATAQFVRPDVDTDPQSEQLGVRGQGPGVRSATDKPVSRDRVPAAGGWRSAKKPTNQPPLKLIAAGIGGLAVVVGAVVFYLSRGDDAPAPLAETVAAVRPIAKASPSGSSPPAALQPTTTSPPPKSNAPSFFTAASVPSAPVVPPPPGDYALLFDGNGLVEFDDLIDVSDKSYTIEAVVRVDGTARNAVICSTVNRGGLGLGGTGDHWRLSQDIVPSGIVSVDALQTIQLGDRHHVAGVRDGMRFRLYVDGKLAAESPADLDVQFKPGKTTPVIGSQFVGVIDELRISKIARYKNDFTPAARHEPDADTLALYHGDEGAGGVLVDSSSYKRNGRIVSAKWVRADGSPVPAATAGVADSTTDKQWLYSAWKPLFDGKSLDGWTGDVGLLTAVNGVLVNTGNRGVVIAPGDYEHGEIELEFRLAERGNSGLGICYAGDGDPAANGLEVQLLDDAAYPTVGPDQRCGALYKLAAAQAGRYKPWPEWNHLVVQTLGRDLTVTLNGTKVVATTRPLLQKSHPEHAGAQRTSGRICLFPHTARSEYRNFRVREATWTVAAAAPTPVTSPSAPVAPPPADYSLDFSGRNGFTVPGVSVDTDGPFTIELTATPLRFAIDADYMNYPLCNVGWVQLKSFAHRNNGTHNWECVIHLENGQLLTLKLGEVVIGRPCRIAVASTGREIRAFVDGRLVAQSPLESPTRQLPGFTVGRYSTMVNGWAAFPGLIDEVRLSKIVRYAQDHEPQARLTADADTLVLYHFDEGAGEEVRDASGGNRHATVQNAQWVRSDGMPVVAAAPSTGTSDLLAAVDPTRDAIAGTWTKENGALLTPEEGNGINNPRMMLPGPAPAEYDVELEVERLGNGGHGMVFGFVLGGRQAVIHMDSFSNPPLWGIGDIDGKKGNANETRNPGGRLPLGVKQTVRIAVRNNRVTVVCNGESIIDWQGKPAQLSNAFWAVPDTSSLFLGTQSPFRIHAIRLTPQTP